MSGKPCTFTNQHRSTSRDVRGPQGPRLCLRWKLQRNHTAHHAWFSNEQETLIQGNKINVLCILRSMLGVNIRLYTSDAIPPTNTLPTQCRSVLLYSIQSKMGISSFLACDTSTDAQTKEKVVVTPVNRRKSAQLTPCNAVQQRKIDE